MINFKMNLKVYLMDYNIRTKILIKVNYVLIVLFLSTLFSYLNEFINLTLNPPLMSFEKA